jgi:hypothetical protein
MQTTALRLMSVLVVAGLFGSLGCAFGEFRPEDPFQRKYSLETAHKIYTDAVRWSKIEEASVFIVDDEKKQFIAMMPKFDQVRFSEWESLPFDLDEELREATIEVTYKGYSMSVPLEVSIHETQTWSREGRGNAWTLRSSFRDLDRLAGN